MTATLVDGSGHLSQRQIRERLPAIRVPVPSRRESLWTRPTDSLPRVNFDAVDFKWLGTLPDEREVYASHDQQLAHVVASFRSDIKQLAIDAIADQINRKIEYISTGPIARVYDVTTPRGDCTWEREVWFTAVPR